MTRRYSMLVAASLMWTSGCGPSATAKGANAPSSDQPGIAGVPAEALTVATQQGFDAALERPSVDAAFTRAIDKLSADPAVAKAGEALLGRIGEHPRFQPVAASFMESLSDSPAFESFIQDFMNDNPSLSPTQIGEAMANHMNQVLERPALDRALDTALDQLFERPDMDAAVEELADAIVEEGGVAEEMATAFVEELASPDVLPLLAARLKTDPESPEFEQALADYLTTPQRTERFLIGFADLFGEHPAPRRAVVDALENATLVDTSAAELAALVGEPEFQRRAELALLAAMSNADEATLTARVEELVLLPAVERRFAGWIRKTARLPAVTRAFGRAFREVAEDPAFRALIEDAYLTDPQVASLDP